jgi:hypothetical protein
MRLIARPLDPLPVAAPAGRGRLPGGTLPLARGEAIAWAGTAHGPLRTGWSSTGPAHA